ncbi:MAG: type II toxin-antitoxin system VapC family toxin [Betaproteobacteria bacterium]|nr:type II toxin-antitoxin system VapC family toxin [Betaproteobacteria bacterium]
MILVDSCIVIDVLEDDSRWAGWSQAQLEAWSVRGPLLINAVIYAELAAYASSKESLESEIAAAGLAVREFPRDALFLAGRAHAAYRRRGGTRASVLADFLVGAHAAVLRIPILTRDVARFRAYFPTVKLVSPD